MDRDISKIRKILNSAYHEEQAVEVSRKSANFSFFVVKGLKPMKSDYYVVKFWQKSKHLFLGTERVSLLCKFEENLWTKVALVTNGLKKILTDS